MEWEKLLSLKRQGDILKRLRKEQDETRLGFEVDYDRIIFSSAFRSLQDKTQVIPLSKTDFIHTRLTHSLEVSVVGRTLGRRVGKTVLEKHPYLETIHGYHFNDFGAIVAAAALSHDIGNPPFGHSGEKAIGAFFKTGKGSHFRTFLKYKEFQDLIDFEGNANGFKILTQSRPGVEGGLRLSYATLGAFMKYPKESLPKKPSPNICDKKFGVFQSEVCFFNEVAYELGMLSRDSSHMSYYRHPLAFLVEAADDICYTIIDFEDGINLGLIEEEVALEYLINLVKNNIDSKKYAALENSVDRLSYLRALSINTLINETVSIFTKNETAILEGTFDVSLLDKSVFKAQIDDIIKISIAKIYNSQEVLEKEIAGHKVLITILDVLTTAIDHHNNDSKSNYDKLILKGFASKVNYKGLPLYEQLLNCCNFVASLSDGNALMWFQKINGVF